MAKKNNAKFNEVFLREYAKLTSEATFRTDSKGRKVRVFTTDAPLSYETVRHFLLNERTVEEDAALETIGYNGLRYAISAGHLVRDEVNPDLLFITTKAAESYKLPRPRVGKHLAV